MKALINKSLWLVLCVFLTACASTPQAVWIDVRTVEEYNESHIDGDLNIPLASIDTDAFADQFGKDAEINLYCRSGNRAGQAKAILEAAGFTNVNNMGGIGDASELRNVAVQSSSQ